MKRKEYPSQRRYLENNPSITFRLKKEDKKKLDAIIEATGKPLSRWMTEFIHENNALYEGNLKLINSLYLANEKIEELSNEERFIIPCSICGEPLTLSSKRKYWNTKVYPKLKDTFNNWYHPKCKSK